MHIAEIPCIVKIGNAFVQKGFTFEGYMKFLQHIACMITADGGPEEVYMERT